MKPKAAAEKNVSSFCAADISDLLAQGDKALNENRLNDALSAYKQAADKNSGDVEVYRKLAKTYFHLKDYRASQENYKIYLDSVPDDTDSIIGLGEAQRRSGLFSAALESFERALQLSPQNDLARRSILETKNNLLACYDAVKAQREKQNYAVENLGRALQMAVDYMTPSYMESLSDVKIVFGNTASMGGTQNIAQYENYKNTITVSEDYIYAAPQVIAAYLSHEAVHAKDNDPYTSITEEQDAYEVATKFWIQNSQGIEDPEMDYAASLYKKSPADLKNRVEEIYVLRDPSISKTSPNHPPQKKTLFNFRKENAASTSLKHYDTIA